MNRSLAIAVLDTGLCDEHFCQNLRVRRNLVVVASDVRSIDSFYDGGAFINNRATKRDEIGEITVIYNQRRERMVDRAIMN